MHLRVANEFLSPLGAYLYARGRYARSIVRSVPSSMQFSALSFAIGAQPRGSFWEENPVIFFALAESDRFRLRRRPLSRLGESLGNSPFFNRSRSRSRRRMPSKARLRPPRNFLILTRR